MSDSATEVAGIESSIICPRAADAIFGCVRVVIHRTVDAHLRYGGGQKDRNYNANFCY